MCAGNVPLPIPKPVCPLACCNRNWKHRAPLLSPPSSPPCPASGGPCQGTWLQDASHNGKQTANNKTTHLKAGGRGIGIDQIAQSVCSFAGPRLLFSNPCQALRAPRLTSGKAAVCEDVYKRKRWSRSCKGNATHIKENDCPRDKTPLLLLLLCCVVRLRIMVCRWQSRVGVPSYTNQRPPGPATIDCSVPW